MGSALVIGLDPFLFDEKLLNRLLLGERAEDVEDMPRDIIEELNSLSDSVTKKLLQELHKLGIDASPVFRHALREWIKLWIYSFVKKTTTV